MKNLSTLLIGVVILSASCSKDKDESSSNNDGSIEGTYSFVGITGFSQTDETESDSGESARSLSRLPYFTLDNKGTITFSKDNLTSSNLSYKMDTAMSYKYYENDDLVDEGSLPFEFNVPASSGTAGYTRVNSDSIFISGGGFMFQDANAPTQTQGGGARISWKNDTLILTAKIYNIETEKDGTYEHKTIYSAEQNIKLVKK